MVDCVLFICFLQNREEKKIKLSLFYFEEFVKIVSWSLRTGHDSALIPTAEIGWELGVNDGGSGL